MTKVEKIEQWVIDRNLHTQDPKIQMCKTMEELGELAKAINKGNKEKQMDGIGDTGIPLCDLSSYLNGKRSLAVYKIERLIQYLGIKLI